MNATTPQLMLGDCLEQMKSLPDNSVDMVLTDIPYGEVNRAAKGVKGTAKDSIRVLNKGKADDCDIDLTALVDELVRVCKGSIYIFCGTEQVSSLRRTLYQHGLSTRLGIWEKSNPSPMNGQHLWLSSVECCVFARKAGATFNERCKSSVWKNPCGRSKVHPTEKPLALMERLVKASSNIGDTVLDCCMGSGTTGVAAINTGRKFVGIERDADYYKIAQDRIHAAQESRS